MCSIVEKSTLQNSDRKSEINNNYTKSGSSTKKINKNSRKEIRRDNYFQ
jgi:hypothetical protein